MAAALLLVAVPAQGQNAPTLSGDTAISVAENTTTATVLDTYTASDDDMDTLAWSKEGDDEGDFTLTENADSTGYELKFAAAPDYENPADANTDNEYKVTVKVTDDEDTPNSTTLNVVVTVTNTDEAGTATIAGTLSGGEELTASVTDPDGNVTSLSWQWQRETSTPGTFSDISSATSNKYTTVAADVGKKLKAKASYTDPQGSGKSAEAETSNAIAASNNEPSFSATTATRTLPENSGAGVNVTGGTITATDDDNDTLAYSLTGTDAASFEIDSNGQVKTKSGVNHDFDFESDKKSYSVTVQVSDGKDAAGDTESPATVDDTIAVTITSRMSTKRPISIRPRRISANRKARRPRRSSKRTRLSIRSRTL